MDALRETQAYAYWFFSLALVVFMCGYIFHIYRSQYKGIRDDEKYGRLALDDELSDDLVEAREEKKNAKKES